MKIRIKKMSKKKSFYLALRGFFFFSFILSREILVFFATTVFLKSNFSSLFSLTFSSLFILLSLLISCGILMCWLYFDCFEHYLKIEVQKPLLFWISVFIKFFSSFIFIFLALLMFEAGYVILSISFIYVIFFFMIRLLKKEKGRKSNKKGYRKRNKIKKDFYFYLHTFDLKKSFLRILKKVKRVVTKRIEFNIKNLFFFLLIVVGLNLYVLLKGFLFFVLIYIFKKKSLVIFFSLTLKSFIFYFWLLLICLLLIFWLFFTFCNLYVQTGIKREFLVLIGSFYIKIIVVVFALLLVFGMLNSGYILFPVSFFYLVCYLAMRKKKVNRRI